MMKIPPDFANKNQQKQYTVLLATANGQTAMSVWNFF